MIGSERDSRFANEADAVRFILKEFHLNPEATAIAGDLMHDIIAGKGNGIFAVGVTDGYGTSRELIGVGADKICDSPSEVLQLVPEIAVGVKSSDAKVLEQATRWVAEVRVPAPVAAGGSRCTVCCLNDSPLPRNPSWSPWVSAEIP